MQIYLAAEHSDCCPRCFCGAGREFEMSVEDAFKREVIHFTRPFSCGACACFPMCLQSIIVSSPPGQLAGRVDEEFTICAPTFTVRNHDNQEVLRIQGPSVFCLSSCGDDIDFKVGYGYIFRLILELILKVHQFQGPNSNSLKHLKIQRKKFQRHLLISFFVTFCTHFQIFTIEGDEIGKISKKWAGLVRELFTDSDFFGIEFPINLDVRLKATLLGALILIVINSIENAPSNFLTFAGIYC